MVPDIDDVDRGILHLLQVDARNTTAKGIAERVDVSPSTVRNRIEALEADGVIRGYQPDVDYEAADLPLEMILVVTAPPTDRSDVVNELLDVNGVVDVRETLTGKRNVHVHAVGTSKTDITRLSSAIHELDLGIESTKIVNNRHTQPFDHFHYEGELVGERVEDDGT